MVTPNVDHIVQLEANKELQAVYKNAALILTDEKLLLVDCKLVMAHHQREDIRPDSVSASCKWLPKKDKCSFSGGKGRRSCKSSKKTLQTDSKGCRSVGTYSPPFGFEKIQLKWTKSTADQGRKAGYS